MKRTFVSLAAATVMAIAVAPAHAELSFNLSWAANSPAAAISRVDSQGTTEPNGTYYAGPLQISGLTGAPAYVPTSFISYCVELTQWTHLGAHSGYTLKPSGTTAAEVQPPSAGQPVDPTKLEVIGKLVTKADATWGVTKTSSQGAAVQAAIWEIIYETSGSFGLRGSGMGVFYWDGSTTTDTEMETIDTWWASLSDVKSNYQFGVLHKAGYAKSGVYYGQDFLVPVPEPEAYGLALAGMGVVAFALRRRRV